MNYNEQKLKILTFYSDSHVKIYENFFLPSYNQFLINNELISKKINQICTTGDYESNGFDITMIEKLNLIIDNIKVNEDKFLVYTDCDVQFFSNLEFNMGDNDILFQEDGNPYNMCAGFFICKQNVSVLNFFKDVKEILINNLNGKIHDQTIINYLFNSGYDKIKKNSLPSNKYWTVGNSIKGIWNDKIDFEIPKELIVHHANFTIGIENKIKLLELVKNKKK